MNQGEGRKQVENGLQFAPNSDDFKDDLRDVLNRVQDAVLLSQPWLFRWMRARYASYADLTVRNAQWSLANAHAITITNFDDSYTQFGYDRLFHALQGNYAVFSDTSSYGAQRFLIERAGLAGGSSSDVQLWLDPRWDVDSKSDTATWTIRFERFPLPADCGGVMSVTRLGDNQPLASWSPTDNMSLLRLDPDETGQARTWLVDLPGFSQPTNRTYNYPTLTQTTPYYGGGEPDLPRAPDTAPTLLSTPGGDLEGGVKYEYAYTWAYGNRESGLSPTATITLDVLDGNVTASALEVLSDGDYGRTRILYRRKAVGGRWVRVGELAATDATTINDSGSAAARPLDRDVRWDGEPCNEWLRLHPRPQDNSEYELVYLRRPRRMQSDQDVPDLPQEFHTLLVHAALLDLQARHSSIKLAAVHQQQYDTLMGRMSSRYLTARQLEIVVKGGMLRTYGAFGLIPPFTMPVWEG